MTPDKILVIVGGAVLIGFVYWFFLSKNKKQKAFIVSDFVDIKVDGGYSPDVIQIPVNK